MGSYDTYVYAVDAQTGKLKWKFQTGNGVVSSAAVSGGMVFVGSRDTYLAGGVVYAGGLDGYLYAVK